MIEMQQFKTLVFHEDDFDDITLVKAKIDMVIKEFIDAAKHGHLYTLKISNKVIR